MTKDIVPEDLETRGEQIQQSSGIITKEQETVKYSAKVFVKEASESDTVNLTSTMSDECAGKPIEVVEEKEVTEVLFMQMSEGDFVEGSTVGAKSKSRFKRDTGCNSIKVMIMSNSILCNLNEFQTKCTSNGQSCWRWPYGSSGEVFHFFQLDTFCISCCEDESSNFASLCNCSVLIKGTNKGDLNNCCE